MEILTIKLIVYEGLEFFLFGTKLSVQTGSHMAVVAADININDNDEEEDNYTICIPLSIDTIINILIQHTICYFTGRQNRHVILISDYNIK